MRTFVARLVGLVVVVAVAFALQPIGMRTLPVNGFTGTIYPWWTWALLGAASLSGAALLVRPGTQVRAWAGAVTFVTGLQLLGTGVVAMRHWRPATGMSVPGDPSNLPDLARAAAVLAVVGLVIALVGAQLVRDHKAVQGAELPLRVRTALLAAAGAFVLVVPLLVVLPHRDVMSWGAAGLMHAGPWAVALAAAAYSRPRLARSLCVVVTVSTLFTVVGPNMVALGLDSRRGWSPALLLAAAAVAVVVVGIARSSAAPTEARQPS